MGVPNESVNPAFPTPRTTSPQSSTSNESNDNQTVIASQTQYMQGKDRTPHGNVHTAISGCSCFQQNAELLCSFKLADYTGSQDACKIDNVLQNIEDALKPWQGLVECPNCAFNGDQEVLQIAFMTIRILLIRLQSQVPPGIFPTTGKRSSVEDKQRPSDDTDTSRPSYSAKMKVGSFEVNEHDNQTVIQVLLLITIHKIKAMMVRFKEMVDRKQKLLQPKAASGPGGQKKGKNSLVYQDHVASNLDHVQHMLQSLGSFLQTLERSLEKEQSDKTGSGR